MQAISMGNKRFALQGLSCGQGFNSFLMGDESLKQYNRIQFQAAILVQAVRVFNHLFHSCNRVRYISAAAACLFCQFTAIWLMYKNKGIDNSFQQRPEKRR